VKRRYSWCCRHPALHSTYMSNPWLILASTTLGALLAVLSGLIPVLVQRRHAKQDRQYEQRKDLYIELLEHAGPMRHLLQEGGQYVAEPHLPNMAMIRGRLTACASKEVFALFDQLSQAFLATSTMMEQQEASGKRHTVQELTALLTAEKDGHLALINQIRRELGSD
jgi:hypothetical protein